VSRPSARRWSGDDGFAGGLEALVFGVLIFVIGTLLVVNAWAVVDAKFATSSAAREAVRAAVETPRAATSVAAPTRRPAMRWPGTGSARNVPGRSSRWG
jgi:hypothetical protein